ncbi:MAG: hypothetical protein NWR97_03970, partial [Salibacteraceae bacterium]|nr:hypothetical protein [Salibacteraceae bacterium]
IYYRQIIGFVDSLFYFGRGLNVFLFRIKRFKKRFVLIVAKGGSAPKGCRAFFCFKAFSK